MTTHECTMFQEYHKTEIKPDDRHNSNQYAFTRLNHEEKAAFIFQTHSIVYFMLIRRTVLSVVQDVPTITTQMHTMQEILHAYKLVLQHRFHMKI